MTYPLHFLHIAMFGKSSMDDVTSIMSQNCGERKRKRKGKRWYIYSRIGSSPITILLNFSPSLIRWQFGRTDRKYAAPTGPTDDNLAGPTQNMQLGQDPQNHPASLSMFQNFSWVFDKNGSSERTQRIILRHSWYVLAIFFALYFQVSPHPESHLVDFPSLISFSLELSKFRRPSNFQNMLYWAFWIAVVLVFLIPHFRNKKKLLSLYV